MTDSGNHRAKALFLDRDGVINVDKGYVYRRDQIEFVDGIFDLCRSAVARRYLIVVVTNQAGVARGYYGESEVRELHSWINERFRERGVAIERFYYCPYHPEHGVGHYRRESECRKPRPGMILQAATDLRIDLEQSTLIGDKASDITAGVSAGVSVNILIGGPQTPTGANAPTHIFPSVRCAASWFASNLPTCP